MTQDAGLFVGRERELARVDELLTATADGQPRVLLVSGDAGAGKTSLLTAALATARRRDFATALGACVDVGRGLPFAPVRAALRTLDERFHDLLVAAVERSPQLALLVRTVERPVDTVLGEHAAALLFEGMLDLITDLTERAPLVVALEDLHWADRSTLELLGFVTRNLSDERLLVLGTIRLPDLAADARLRQLVAELQRVPLVQRLDLGGLGKDDLRELARRVTGREPPAERLDALHARTEGNPFFVVELLRADDGALPPTIRDVLAATLAHLDDAGARVVRAAAAIGREVHADLLAAVSGLPALDVAGALRSAVEAGVLVALHGDVVAFRHALLQEAAYATLVPLERRALHVAIAEQLTEHPEWQPGLAIDAVLAYHHDRAGRPEPAFTASLRAARTAVADYGFSEAHTHLARALDLWPLVPDADEIADGDEIDVRLLAADCAAWAGRAREARALVEEALALLTPEADRVRWAQVVDRTADLRWQEGDMPAALALLEQASDVLGDGETIECARIQQRLAMYRLLATGSADGLELARCALKVARDVGDVALEAEALDTLGCIECAVGNFGDGMRLLDEAFERARRTGNAQALMRAGINRMNTYLIASRLRDAERAGKEAIAAVHELGIERCAVAEFMGGYPRVLWLRGAWDEAEDVLRSTLRAGWSRSDSYIDLSAAMLALGHGDTDEAERLLEQARHDLAGNQFNAGRWYMTHLQIRLVQGRAAEAFEIATEALPQMMRTPGPWFAAITAYALEAAHAAGGLAAESGELRRQAVERYERMRARGSIPAEIDAWMELVHAWHAEISRSGDPLPHWDAAARRFGDLEYVVDVAWIDLQRARLLVEAGDRARAAELVGAAHALAVRLGARALRSRLEDLARRARLSVPSITAAPSAEQLGLTDREVEVLRLLAEGRTNKEIGEELFISTRTASVHVSNIIRKLGVTNRGEAAALAHRHGLVEAGNT